MLVTSSRLQIDSLFTADIGVTKQKSYAQYLSDWKNQMNEAIQIAQQMANKSAEQNRDQYNKKVHGNDIVIGESTFAELFGERRHWQTASSLGKHVSCTFRKRGQLIIL